VHFMPEDEGYVEKLWPDGYRAVLQNALRPVIASALQSEDTLRHAHAAHYGDQFQSLEPFVDRIIDMLVIGAEKGADEALDDIVNVFLYEEPLPEPRAYKRYLLLTALPGEVKRPLVQRVVEEYSEDEVFAHAFKVGYWDLYEDFDTFLAESAKLVAVGALNGMDDMLSAIYRAFAVGGPLPPSRRNAKRVKNWFVPKGSKRRDVPLSRRARQKRQMENSGAEDSGLR